MTFMRRGCRRPPFANSLAEAKQNNFFKFLKMKFENRTFCSLYCITKRSSFRLVNQSQLNSHFGLLLTRGTFKTISV